MTQEELADMSAKMRAVASRLDAGKPGDATGLLGYSMAAVSSLLFELTASHMKLADKVKELEHRMDNPPEIL